jgi:branched-subunit amino acid transport protein
MSVTLIVALAVITYGSRAAVLVILPDPPPALRRVLDQMPAPLFAGLAALSLVRESGALAPPPVLAAAAGAICAVPFRSLLVTLAGGLAGFALGSVLAR